MAAGFLEDMPTSDPTAPSDARDELIAVAIRRAVIDQKDVPDYNLLKDKSRIVLSNRTMPLWQGGGPSDSGGGYRLEYSHRGETWSFKRIVSSWIH